MHTKYLKRPICYRDAIRAANGDDLVMLQTLHNQITIPWTSAGYMIIDSYKQPTF